MAMGTDAFIAGVALGLRSTVGLPVDALLGVFFIGK
jgi:hypothetical protein